LKVLHVVRRAGDELAWEAIRSAPGDDDVRVALIHDAADAGVPVGDGGKERLTVMVDPEYDQIVDSIEWADKVVTW
jgi:hypothetical protein